MKNSKPTINDNAFRPFAKGGQTIMAKGNNCVIYTRVSTKEQADNNLSLETQKKACEAFAKKNNYVIVGYYGGTYESAKTDERKEFNRMLAFVKNAKERVFQIIVFSVDRFSRSGANAIYLAEQLKKQGIGVCSVTQPTDASTASGGLQQNIQFIFSEYENQQRREKCMAGVKEMLLRGEWCTAPPIGYDTIKSNGKRAIVINYTGKLLRKAFFWKAREKVTNEEIIKRLKSQGLKIYSQRMSAIFRNPFYCGILTHSALDGETVEGNHEKIISKEIFLEVNGVISAKKQGYKCNPENNYIPLKRFLKCDNCGKYLRAYKASKNNEYYYKCNTIGCNCNKRADSVHKRFIDLLSSYDFEMDYSVKQLVEQQMIASYNQLTKENENDVVGFEVQLNTLKTKLDRLEERFVLEEINKEMFEKFESKFLLEIDQLNEQKIKMEKNVSNIEFYIHSAIQFGSKLDTVWHSSNYIDRQKIQFLLFPDGLFYNRRNDECRTLNVNNVFIASDQPTTHYKTFSRV